MNSLRAWANSWGLDNMGKCPLSRDTMESAPKLAAILSCCVSDRSSFVVLMKSLPIGGREKSIFVVYSFLLSGVKPVTILSVCVGSRSLHREDRILESGGLVPKMPKMGGSRTFCGKGRAEAKEPPLFGTTEAMATRPFSPLLNPSATLRATRAPMEWATMMNSFLGQFLIFCEAASARWGNSSSPVASPPILLGKSTAKTSPLISFLRSSQIEPFKPAPCMHTIPSPSIVCYFWGHKIPDRPGTHRFKKVPLFPMMGNPISKISQIIRGTKGRHPGQRPIGHRRWDGI